jgi:hypothetical protein
MLAHALFQVVSEESSPLHPTAMEEARGRGSLRRAGIRGVGFCGTVGAWGSTPRELSEPLRWSRALPRSGQSQVLHHGVCRTGCRHIRQRPPGACTRGHRRRHPARKDGAAARLHPLAACAPSSAPPSAPSALARLPLAVSALPHLRERGVELAAVGHGYQRPRCCVAASEARGEVSMGAGRYQHGLSISPGGRAAGRTPSAPWDWIC